MTPRWQIPRTSLLWLLTAQLAIVGGLYVALPGWVIAVVVFSCIWRLQVHRGAWSYPESWLKLLLVIACSGGLLLSFQRLTGLEPLASLLVCAAAFKLLEIHRRRDGLILIFVCYFAAVLQLLFEQTMLVAAYGLFCVLLVTAALTGLYQQGGGRISHWLPLRRGSILLLQSLPLMLVMFLVMPRLPAFWAVPGQQQAATGVSGEMSPGDFTSLGKDGALAFRASFEGETPATSQLYWRGPILTRFDGRRWSQIDPVSYGDGAHIHWGGTQPPRWLRRIEQAGDAQRYTVVMEASQRRWLFALATPGSDDGNVGLTREMRLISRQPVSRKMQYSVNWWPQYRYFAGGLHPWQRRQVLEIPDGYNPRARELATSWRSESANTQTYVARVLDWYNREFSYTLQPAGLGQHSVDEFLWNSQSGFCEHFASSFVFLMRAAGVPSRVVTGYQGGELHPEGYLLVHQYNAHAWAEIWLPGRGWVSVDPTAAVAPGRIEQGFEAFFQQRQGFLEDSPFSLSQFRHIDWLNNLRLKLDSLDYYWSKWVLGYQSQQKSVLTKWLGGISWTHVGLFLLGSGAVMVAVILLWLLRGNLIARRSDPLDRYFERLCNKLARADWPRQLGEGPQEYRQRLERSHFCDAVANSASVILALRLYEKIRYADQQQHLAAFRREVSRF